MTANTIETQFKKKSLHQHILDLPDTYIGSVQKDHLDVYIYDDNLKQIIKKNCEVVLGLYKIFDEIIVNASDHTVRDDKCDMISVRINKDTGEISVANNGGNIIPVEIHKGENMYVPEMIFGNLLTSGNYDQKGKIVGGKNGIGSKATAIYSTKFTIKIIDIDRMKKYKQVFSNNMFNKDKPIISDIEDKQKYDKSMIEISFIPDYKRFGFDNLTDDMYSLMKRRVYDIAGTTKNRAKNPVKVYFNSEDININTFEDYIKLYYQQDQEIQLIYEDYGQRWKVGVVFDPTSGYQHVSFVNHISTFMGGTHLNYITDQIVRKIIEIVEKKNKNLEGKIKSNIVKDNISVYINSVIEDPAFSSQAKEFLTTKSSLFGSTCEISDDFIKKLAKTDIIEEIANVANVKQLSELKKSDGKKLNNLKGIPKLEDARLAGSKHSPDCRLILTEGDSAKTFAINGLSIIGRDKYGVFPLKGKLLNVREATPKQLINNQEIKNLKQILGLKQNQHYKDTTKLRYGGIIILTDQDHDGSHIKGLLMNFLHFFWPSLIQIKGFIQSISTPIIKAFKKSDKKRLNSETFYTIQDYKEWVSKIGNDIDKYETKYYKGLGTSTENEAKECFEDFEQKVLTYIWNNNNDTNKINISIDNSDVINSDLVSSKSKKSSNSTNSNKSNKSKKSIKEDKEDNEDNIDYNEDKEEKEEEEKEETDESINEDRKSESYQAITLAFAKTRANDRKEWLKKYDEEQIINTKERDISIKDFVNKELIHFSNYDNIRSIPDIMDGFKPSQRKIIYGAFKRDLYSEIKVAQLSGYISEHSGYHHGEMSLQGAIINMAQDFVGTNNINLFVPKGNFGSRRLGGEDAASSRYIFTHLDTITKYIFIDKDKPILKYNIEDGDTVEPETYYPIIPMILVNGSKGIGTGYSTFIPCYNPKEIIRNIRKKLKNDEYDIEELKPWYRGFNGEIEMKDSKTFITNGIYSQKDECTLKIKELPVGTWTENYLEYLDEMAQKENSIIKDYYNNSDNRRIDITVVFNKGQLPKLVKNDSIMKTLKLTTQYKTSNMYLYKNHEIVKYNSIKEIIEDFMEIRKKYYKIRKDYVIRVLENELAVLKYRKMFIEEVLNKTIIIERQKKIDIINNLIKKGYPELNTNINGVSSYNYLTDLPLFSLTEEKIDEINKTYEEKNEELDVYKNTSVEELWIMELDELEKVYDKFMANFEKEINGDSKKKNTKDKKDTKDKKVIKKK
jgi:DNA topoisomerase-2